MVKRYTWEEVQAAAAAVHEEYRKKLAPYIGKVLDEESGPHYHKLVDEYHAAVKRVREDHGWTEHRPELIDTPAKLRGRIEQLVLGREMEAEVRKYAGMPPLTPNAAARAVLIEALKLAADGGLKTPQPTGDHEVDLQTLRAWCNTPTTPDTDSKPVAVVLNKEQETLRIGNDTITLEANEAAVLKVLVEKRPAALKDLRQSGVERPDLVLKNLVKKYRVKYPVLKDAIRLPGARGRGGYNTSIVADTI